jgi:hypothetical protein
MKILGVFVLSLLDGILIILAAHSFFEIANGFAQAAANLRQFAGTENDQRDCQDN